MNLKTQKTLSLPALAFALAGSLTACSSEVEGTELATENENVGDETNIDDDSGAADTSRCPSTITYNYSGGASQLNLVVGDRVVFVGDGTETIEGPTTGVVREPVPDRTDCGWGWCASEVTYQYRILPSARGTTLTWRTTDPNPGIYALRNLNIAARIARNCDRGTEPLANARLVNLVSGLPSLVASIDGISPNFGSPFTAYFSAGQDDERSEFQAFAASESPVALSELGLGTALATRTYDFEAGTNYTLYAYRLSASEVALERVEENLRAPTGNNVSLRLFHTATGVGAVDIYELRGSAAPRRLVRNFAISESETITAPSGARDIGIDADRNGSIDLRFDLPTLRRGTVGNLFIAKAASGDVELVWLLGGVTSVERIPAL